MVKKITAFLIILFLFSFTVCAEESDIYSEQYKNSGVEELTEALPDEARDFLEQNELVLENADWVNNLSAQNVFTHIMEFVKSGGKTPLAVTISLIGIILISALISNNTSSSSALSAAVFATVAATAGIICVPIFSVIQTSVNAMKACTVFMTAFIPVFAVMVASSSAALTAVSSSATLLLATQVVSYITNFVIMPLMSGFLGVSIASNISPIISKSGIADGIRKIAFWIMSLVSAVFIGVLSVQTAVNSAADNLTLKTAKFIIGSAVPFAGTVLSESLSTVTSSMSLLKSSVGIYGVVSLCVIFLPLIIELLLWRVGLIISSAVADLFSVGKISSLFRSIDSMMSLLIGIILLTLAMFIISLGVVVSAGGAR